MQHKVTGRRRSSTVALPDHAAALEPKQAEEIGSRDSLTGLGHRRYFDNALDEEIARAREEDMHSASASPTSIISRRSTTIRPYGRRRGPQAFADLLTANIKGEDKVARFGGEEFAILFPDADLADATSILSQIQNSSRASAGRSRPAASVSARSPLRSASRACSRASRPTSCCAASTPSSTKPRRTAATGSSSTRATAPWTSRPRERSASRAKTRADELRQRSRRGRKRQRRSRAGSPGRSAIRSLPSTRLRRRRTASRRAPGTRRWPGSRRQASRRRSNPRAPRRRRSNRPRRASSRPRRLPTIPTPSPPNWA